jgi:hypothetical protein
MPHEVRLFDAGVVLIHFLSYLSHRPRWMILPYRYALRCSWQNEVLMKLCDVAGAVKRAKGSERKEVLMSEMATTSIPGSFQLAWNPRIEAKGLILEKCKFMDSKKVSVEASGEYYRQLCKSV